VIYTIIFLVFFGTLGYTLPFVLSLVFALILQKPTKYIIKKFKLGASIASIITTFLFFSLIILLLSLGITALTSELILLGKNVQTYITENSPHINNYIDGIKQYLQNLDPLIINRIENNLSNSSYISKISSTTASIIGGVVTILLSFLTSIPYIIMVVLFTFLSTYFFTKDLTIAKTKVTNIFTSENADRLRYILNETKKMLGSYLISYTIIISITFIETLIGFLVFKVKYALLLSILSAVFDILPLLGIGSIYIPVAIIYALSGKYVTVACILILYVIVSIIRQIIEPKIVSSSLGIHPVPILAAIFIGLKANGISGMFFCIFFVVFYNILKKVNLL
jgi:sporulation integral membrane protein YtvI